MATKADKKKIESWDERAKLVGSPEAQSSEEERQLALAYLRRRNAEDVAASLGLLAA